MSLYLKTVQLAAIYAVFNVAGAAIIKDKLLIYKISTVQDFLLFLIDPKILVAILFILVSMYFSIRALSLSNFSSVIPLMTAINFSITVLVGVLYFKEQLAISGYVGIALILAGVVFLGKGYSGG